MANSTDGRNYHTTKSGYSLPNDSPEHARLDEQHEAVRQMMGGDSFATSFADLTVTSQKNGLFKAVDIGTGTGVMAVHMASRLPPDALVYGVDISAVPPIHDKPKNLEYVQGNIMDLPDNDDRFKPGTFDFVFHRFIVLGMSDWEAYLYVCFSLLKPGGRVEMQESSLQWRDPQGNRLPYNDWKWVRVFRKATAKFGIDPSAVEKLQQRTKDCGFVDVEERVYKWSITDQHWEECPQSDATGKYTVKTLNDAFAAGVIKVAQRAGLEEADLEGLENLDAIKDDYLSTVTGRPVGTHGVFYVVTGRKP